jgi:hypothetical protein
MLNLQHHLSSLKNWSAMKLLLCRVQQLLALLRRRVIILPNLNWSQWPVETAPDYAALH